MVRQTRAPKLLGDFGEGLVTYALIRKGFEVACVDHVGADLIAEKRGRQYAVSVKTRLFREGSQESLAFIVRYSHIDKLKYFARQFNLTPLFALVVCLADEKMIHLIMLKASDLKKLPKVKHGYSIRFAKSTRDKLLDLPFIDYSCWRDERIGILNFT